jgi:hypothetical protein
MSDENRALRSQLTTRTNDGIAVKAELQRALIEVDELSDLVIELSDELDSMRDCQLEGGAKGVDRS